jgi:DNA repair and recombination protein RAD52
MFTTDQINSLKAPLDKANVKSRAQAGRQLSYIEGWKAIEEANRIFGFDAWDRETFELRQLGEPREVEGKFRVAYMARVRVRVRTGAESPASLANNYTPSGAASILRDGTGYGSGIDRDLGQDHESAIKEAETDAMKRALMTFGNPFGLALYDKEQRNVSDEAPQARSAVNTPLPESLEPDPDTQAAIAYVQTAIQIISVSKQSEKDLRQWWTDESGKRREYKLTQAQVSILLGKLKEKIEGMANAEAA